MPEVTKRGKKSQWLKSGVTWISKMSGYVYLLVWGSFEGSFEGDRFAIVETIGPLGKEDKKEMSER